MDDLVYVYGQLLTIENNLNIIRSKMKSETNVELFNTLDEIKKNISFTTVKLKHLIKPDYKE